MVELVDSLDLGAVKSAPVVTAKAAPAAAPKAAPAAKPADVSDIDEIFKIFGR